MPEGLIGDSIFITTTDNHIYDKYRIHVARINVANGKKARLITHVVGKCACLKYLQTDNVN